MYFVPSLWLIEFLRIARLDCGAHIILSWSGYLLQNFEPMYSMTPFGTQRTISSGRNSDQAAEEQAVLNDF